MILKLIKRFSLFCSAFLFLFLSFLILALNAGEDRETSIPEKVLMEISFPFQDKVHRAVSWVKRVGERYLFHLRLEQENRELKQLVDSLREENNHLKELVLAEGRLKKLLPLQARYSRPSTVANVLARDPSSWFKSVLVNRGERDNVIKDMTVVSASGLVGRVIEASPDTAKVLLITDPNSAVDVILQRSRSQVIMEGKAEESCLLKYVPKSDDIEPGDPVITSGLGGIFPKGLMVGVVSKVDRKKPGIFQYVEVMPSADLTRLEEVLIIGNEAESSP